MEIQLFRVPWGFFSPWFGGRSTGIWSVYFKLRVGGGFELLYLCSSIISKRNSFVWLVRNIPNILIQFEIIIVFFTSSNSDLTTYLPPKLSLRKLLTMYNLRLFVNYFHEDYSESCTHSLAVFSTPFQCYFTGYSDLDVHLWLLGHYN